MGGRQVKLRDFLQPSDTKHVFVYALRLSESGSVSSPLRGADYATDTISLCPWEMTATAVCQAICHEHEFGWGIGVCLPSNDMMPPESPHRPFSEHQPLLSSRSST